MAGLERAKAQGVTLGRPRVARKVENAIRTRLARGEGIPNARAADAEVQIGSPRNLRHARLTPCAWLRVAPVPLHAIDPTRSPEAPSSPAEAGEQRRRRMVMVATITCPSCRADADYAMQGEMFDFESSGHRIQCEACGYDEDGPMEFAQNQYEMRV
jgi:hypothetical protein